MVATDARCRGAVVVTSSNGVDRYVVEFDGPDRRCECKSFQFRGRCPHVDELNEVLRRFAAPRRKPAGKVA